MGAGGEQQASVVMRREVFGKVLEVVGVIKNQQPAASRVANQSLTACKVASCCG